MKVTGGRSRKKFADRRSFIKWVMTVDGAKRKCRDRRAWWFFFFMAIIL